MAMIKCPECGRMISNQAEMCPGCGISQEKIQQMLGQKRYSPVEHPKKSRRMIRCTACNNETEDGHGSRCQLCGYPFLSLSADKKIVKRSVQTFRKKQVNQEEKITENVNSARGDKKPVKAKVIAVVVCICLIIGLMIGKGTFDFGEKKEVSGDSQQEVAADSLTVAIWDANQEEGIQEICDDWSAESGIPVKIEVIDWDNYWMLLESAASGGTLPDVFWMHSDFSQIYMENDILLDLTDYIKNDGVDMDQYYQDLVAIYTRDDSKIFGLPKDHDTIALLYNKAIFDEAGVDYPTNDWTYEDMYEAAKKITENTPDDTYGVGLNTSNDQDGWYNYVYSYGGTIIDPDRKDTHIDSAEGKAGMEMVRKMLTVGTPQAVVSESGTDALFISGKIAMITQGAWMINTFYTAENAKDYAWAMIPYADVNGDGQCQPEERQSCYNGLGWSAAANTANPDAAASLIEYLCSEPAQIKQAELGVSMAGIPGISGAFANAYAEMDVSAFDQIEAEGILYARPGTRNSGVWKNPMEQAEGFLPAWQNPEDPYIMEAACDNVAGLIRTAIACE